MVLFCLSGTFNVNTLHDRNMAHIGYPQTVVQRNMARNKSRIRVGDVFWLNRSSGDKGKTPRRYDRTSHYDEYGDYDSDICDSDTDSDSYRPCLTPISPSVRATYEKLGLDRSVCSHPCVVVDLFDGKYGDESKVLVCIVSELMTSIA